MFQLFNDILILSPCCTHFSSFTSFQLICLQLNFLATFIGKESSPRGIEMRFSDKVLLAFLLFICICVCVCVCAFSKVEMEIEVNQNHRKKQIKRTRKAFKKLHSMHFMEIPNGSNRFYGTTALQVEILN